MKYFALILALCALCVATTAQADGLFFAQDDFVLIYGTPGSPGSAGASFTMDGRLVNWDTNSIAAWFVLSGSNSAGAYPVGSQYRTDYDTDIVLKITSMPMGAGTLLWEGTGSVYTLVNMDQSGFDAASFDRPAWYNPTIISSGYVSEFQSVGSGAFTKTTGPWDYAELAAPWFGTYDWNFCFDGQTEIGATGNLQGKLVVVPEPGSLLTCLAGLLGCAGLVRRRS